MPVETRGTLPTLVHQDRLNQIRERIQLAAERSNRSGDVIRLVAVTKTVPVDPINDLISQGVFELGENRIQEALEKRGQLQPNVGQRLVHHFLGSLQTNKARQAVEFFDLIQSVDRPKLAVVLDREAYKRGKVQDCLIEVKVSLEDTKTGVLLAEAPAFIKGFSQYKNLHLKGLMTIPSFDMPSEETRQVFQSFKSFFDKQAAFLGEAPILSMGMSDDFEIAVEEGATMVRVGRALFGPRPPQ